MCHSEDEAYDVSPLISVVPNLEVGYVNIGFTGCLLWHIWKRGVSKKYLQLFHTLSIIDLIVVTVATTLNTWTSD